MSRKTLKRPLVTEKLTRLMEEGQYAFVVDIKANKPQIRAAIEKRYPGVKVDRVRTMIQRGKKRRQFTRQGVMEGRTAYYKKAIITLKPDSEEIDFFEAV